MKTLLIAAIAITPLLLAKDHESARRLDDSAQVFAEVMSTPDKGIPQEMLEHANCIVIVPDLKTAAFFFGAKYGKGFISCRNKSGVGWSAPGAVRIEGGSVGFQIGGEATDFVILVMNNRGATSILKDKVKLGADLSASAGPKGRDASAETDATLRAEMLTYSRSRGLFAGVSLEGSTVRPDKDANEELYQRKLEPADIVLKGVVPPPAAAQEMIETLTKFSPRNDSDPNSLK